MAEFCKQCSIDMWGKDTGDFKELISPEEVAEGYGAVVLCEGCGVIRVDHEGTRLIEEVDLDADSAEE